MPLAFITSTGRTGTTFLTHLINTCCVNAASVHEPRPTFRSRGPRQLLENAGLFEEVYFKFSRKYHANALGNKDWYIESNHYLFACIPMIRTVFPEAKVVHLIRDGRDVTSSWLNRYRYILHNQITPLDLKDQETAELWKKWTPIQKIAWLWIMVNNTAEKQQPDAIYRFEKLFNPQGDAMIEFLKSFEGLSFDVEKVRSSLNKKVNKNKTEFFPEYKEWPLKWKKQFYEIAAEEMERLGYPGPDW